MLEFVDCVNCHSAEATGNLVFKLTIEKRNAYALSAITGAPKQA